MLVAGALQAGFPTELWTVKRVRALVAREFGVEYTNSGGWELLRSLGFSPQKPEKRATQRDEQAIVRLGSARLGLRSKKKVLHRSAGASQRRPIATTANLMLSRHRGQEGSYGRKPVY